jgi:hypothetical protein
MIPREESVDLRQLDDVELMLFVTIWSDSS